MSGSDRYGRLVDRILDEYRASPVDFTRPYRPDRSCRYLIRHRASYVRTIRDLDRRFAARPGRRGRILEIGSWYGLTSIALSRLGFDVTAADLGDYIRHPVLRKKFEREGIRSAECDLVRGPLPLDAGRFDAVVFCEVLEHLNSNPLPVLLEIRRVLKPRGLLYLSTPNLARWDNRLKLMEGRSIHPPIRDYAAQLDPADCMKAGLHWREYTADEIRQLLRATGFGVRRLRAVDESHPARRRSEIELFEAVRRRCRIQVVYESGRVRRVLYRTALGVGPASRVAERWVCWAVKTAGAPPRPGDRGSASRRPAAASPARACRRP